MKKYLTLLILTAWLTLLAQNKIVGYQYAFNNGQNLTYVPITPTTDFHLQTDIDVSNLTSAINQLHIRFVDENGQWSGILSHLFINQNDMTQQDLKITGYEYFFNNDTTNRTFVAINPQDDFNLITDIDVSNLNDTVNTIHFRYKDSNGQWSGILSHLFIKNDMAQQDLKITGYEYFFNNDSANRTFVAINPQDDFNLITDIDVSNLNNTVNTIHFRFQDNNGQWSGIIAKIFIRPIPNNNLPNNALIAYEYWFDDDRSNLRNILVPAQQDLYIGDLDMNHIWRGSHTIHTRYKDTYGQYSGITTDTIIKLSHPLAIFSTSTTQICQGESVQFTDNGSIDYDTVQWDFGDGSTSNNLNENHTYNTAGIYTATLTVTDTNTGMSDSSQIDITVNALPDNGVTSSHVFPACFGETVTLTANATGMNYLWNNGATTQSIDVTNAGTYSVTITGSNGCAVTSDDIVVSFTTQIDNTVTSSHTFPACFGETVTLTANATGMNYLWNNGATTQSIDVTNAGTYSVTISDNNGCTVTSDDIDVSYYPAIDTTVSVNSNPVELVAQQNNASYQWVDCDNNYNPIAGETNQNFIPSVSGSYAVEITMNGCTATSDCINVTVTGINGNELPDKIRLYPNPADKQIQIDTDIHLIEVEISNLQGRKIFLQNLSGKQKEINISRLQPGLYLIKIRLLSGEFTGQTLTYKMIKK